MRTMFDSVSASRIPAGAAMVAGYASGRYRWSPRDWALFPHAAKIRIDVDGTAPFASDVADCERYDLSVAGAVDWVRKRHEVKGWWSAVYVSLSGLQQLVDAMGELPCEYWVAQWTDHPHLINGRRVVACQYESTRNYDLSLVGNDDWFPTPAAA